MNALTSQIIVPTDDSSFGDSFVVYKSRFDFGG
jgi:hypothetical protein